MGANPAMWKRHFGSVTKVLSVNVGCPKKFRRILSHCHQGAEMFPQDPVYMGEYSQSLAESVPTHSSRGGLGDQIQVIWGGLSDILKIHKA